MGGGLYSPKGAPQAGAVPGTRPSHPKDQVAPQLEMDAGPDSLGSLVAPSSGGTGRVCRGATAKSREE
jgi:hypothetical protein